MTKTDGDSDRGLCDAGKASAPPAELAYATVAGFPDGTRALLTLVAALGAVSAVGSVVLLLYPVWTFVTGHGAVVFDGWQTLWIALATCRVAAGVLQCVTALAARRTRAFSGAIAAAWALAATDIAIVGLFAVSVVWITLTQTSAANSGWAFSIVQTLGEYGTKVGVEVLTALLLRRVAAGVRTT